MRICTWQGRGHRITTGKVDLSQSDYFSVDYEAKIVRLSNLLGREAGQFLWSYREEVEATRYGRKHCDLWELNVPESDISCYYDNIAWHKIIGMRGSFWRIRGHRIAKHLERAAEEMGLEDWPDKQRFYEAREAEWWVPEPEEQLWNRLFQKDGSSPFAEVLIPFPAKENWVV